METYKIYVGGEFKVTDKELIVRNSYSNEIVGKTYLATEEECEEAINKALLAKEKIKCLSSYERYEVLQYIATEIEKKKELFTKIIALEACKPYKYAAIEVERAINTFRVSAEEAKRLPSEHIYLDWTSTVIKKEGIVRYFPIGIVLGIVPFNFPLNLAAHKIGPAIASGNCIIIKPSTHTPLTMLEFAKIINQTYLPTGTFSVLPTTREVGFYLIKHQNIDKLSFTGSSEVGWYLKNICGKKKITLELGGNSAVIISQTANLDEAIPKTVTGAFAYQGQICIHTQRIYVHHSIYSTFLEKFLEKVKKLKIGHPLEIDTDISAMIDEESAIRVEEWIKEAINQGAELIYGGKRNCAIIEPTILTNTNSKMKINKLEVFGPVVVIEKYYSFEEAVNLVNDTEYGLQAGVFTDSLKEMNYAYENIKVGAVLINESPTFRIDHMPYGGIKNSGFGREGIKYAIKEMMEPKLLVKPF